MAAAAALLRRLEGAPHPHLGLAALLIAVGHGAYALAAGVTMASDSAAYAHWSARLVGSGFDYPGVLAEARTSFPAILYVLFATLLASLRLVFGGGWGTALVALNLATHVALGLLVVRMAGRITGSGTAGWLALLLFLGCFDLLIWVPFILSDATFVFLAFGIFTLAAARILGESKRWLPVLAPAALGIFYRPTGLVLVPDLALAIYLAGARVLRTSCAVAIAGLAGAIVVTAFAFAWFMQDPGRWPLDVLAGAFGTVAHGYSVGEVVSARPETFHPPPRQLIDYVLISADRFLHFFAFDAAGFSALHTAVKLAFFLPCYALAAWLLAALWRRDTRFGDRERKVFLAAAAAILSYALFHGLVQVDYDWRYRVPILPHLILLAAGGAADLLRRSVTE